MAVGQTAATNIIHLRDGDGRMTPIGVTSSFPDATAGPGRVATDAAIRTTADAVGRECPPIHRAEPRSIPS